jgi:hypothetical protein
MPNPAIDILLAVLLCLVFFESLFPGMLTTALITFFVLQKHSNHFKVVLVSSKQP